ncbi:kinase-like domain-containing protein [Rhodocollybia butyracea]|uniref:Kinase-like domain-containing protein n=1 Tax=Rhodocollybia butyracea TaxID=206335 RepID=A0A9P5PD86_9AGAR|nr:kinase-like domain-containing protein [Rhodocollybia butyracea]
MPPTLSSTTRDQTLALIAADEHYDDSEKDFSEFVSGAEEASGVMELLQTELDHARATNDHQSRKKWKRCSKLMRYLNRQFGVLPPSMILHSLVCESKRAVKGGGFADVWIGCLDDRRVCMKVLRYFQEGSERDTLLKALSKEVLLWRQLNHPNILPFLGVNTELFTPSFCIVSPWMLNGDIISYAQKNPLDLDMKLKHIYRPPKSLKVSYTCTGWIRRPISWCLTTVVPAALLTLAYLFLDTQSMNPTQTASTQGSLRWLAPEFINPPSYPVTGAGMLIPRDIYAFGCTVFELLTGKPPFSHFPQDITVAMKVLGGERPSLPAEAIPRESVFKSMYSMLKWCWSEKNSDRPSAQGVLDFLTNPQDLSLLKGLEQREISPTPKDSTNSTGPNEEHHVGGGVVAPVAWPSGSASFIQSFSHGLYQQQHSDRVPTIPPTVPESPDTSSPGASSNEVSVNELDFNQPSTLEMYSVVLLFKNDHTRDELICPTTTPQQLRVIQLITKKLGLYHYPIGEGGDRCAVVTRVDTQKPKPKRIPGLYLRTLRDAAVSTGGMKSLKRSVLPKRNLKSLPRPPSPSSWPTSSTYTSRGSSQSLPRPPSPSSWPTSSTYTSRGSTHLPDLNSVLMSSPLDTVPGRDLPWEELSLSPNSYARGQESAFGRNGLTWDDPLLYQAWSDFRRRSG